MLYEDNFGYPIKAAAVILLHFLYHEQTYNN